VKRTINEPISDADRRSNPFGKRLYLGERLQKKARQLVAALRNYKKTTEIIGSFFVRCVSCQLQYELGDELNGALQDEQRSF